MDIPENLTDLMMQPEKENDNGNSANATTSEESADQTTGDELNFMFSSIPDDKRQKLMDFLNTKGISYSNMNACDPKSTHIIVQKMSRSEKMLGSIASGKYVIHPSYMEACFASDKILPTERYEWGNPENGFLADKSLGDQEKKLASAAFRWRKIVQSGIRSGAFSGFKAIIHTSNSRFEAFRRLLELGSGSVVKATPPYSNTEGATHCLAEPQRRPNVKMDYKALAKNGVPVVGLLYLNEYLVCDPPPKVNDYLIDDFRPFWQKRDSKI